MLSSLHSHTPFRLLPYAGCEYQGEWFKKNNCAVSILRTGMYIQSWSTGILVPCTDLEGPLYSKCIYLLHMYMYMHVAVVGGGSLLDGLRWLRRMGPS